MSFAIFTQCFITVDLCVVCLHFNQCLLLFVCMLDLGIRTTKHVHMKTHWEIPKELWSVWFGFMFRNLAKLPHLELGMVILCTPSFTNNYTWVASDPVFTEFGETFVADVEADPLGWSVCIGTTGNGLFVEFTYTA